jgi:hypothetical protein
MSYYFLQIFLFVDVERRTAEMKLICHDTDGPKIHFFIILFTLQEFR